MQALEFDKDMAMAYWCIALSAAGDYRPAFQLLREPANGGPRNGGICADSYRQAQHRADALDSQLDSRNISLPQPSEGLAHIF